MSNSPRNDSYKTQPRKTKRYNTKKPFYKKWPFWVAIGATIVIVVTILIVIICIIINGQNGAYTDTSSSSDQSYSNSISEKNQKSSSDINIAYVKQYVGTNLASSCSWSWINTCLFPLKAGNKSVNLKVNITSSDGRNISNDDTAKAYRITSQSLPQNTEIQVQWDDDDWTLTPDEIDINVEPIGKIKEVTKTGEMERYECEAKGNRTGRVLNFIRKNSSSGLQSDSYDIVNCEWTEVVTE